MKAQDVHDRFIERAAVQMEADGLPRIAGRIIGLFLLMGGPFSFSEIAERLQVSRGSISTNLRLVRERGVIELVSRPGERQDYYQLAANPYRSSIARALDQLESLRHLAQETADELGKQDPAVHKRLQNMARVNAMAAKHVKATALSVSRRPPSR